MKEVSRDAQLHGIYYANEELKLDAGRYPLNYDFYEPEDVWETNVRGEPAYVIGIRSAINANDIDGYIVAVDGADGRRIIVTYEKQRLAELNGTTPPKSGYDRGDYTQLQEISRNERRRQRRHNARERRNK